MSSFDIVRHTRIALGIATFAALTACGNGAATPSAAVPAAPQNAPAPAVLTQSAAVALPGSINLSEAAANTTASALHDITSSLGTGDAKPKHDAAVASAAGASPAPSATPCVVASPQPPVDANNNGIPDNEAYTVSGCTQAWAGGRTAALTGQFTIVDNSQPGGALAWTRTVNGMTVNITGPNNFNATDLRNGAGVHTLVSPTQETIVRNFTDVWTVGTNAYTATNSLNVSFTSNGDTIVPVHALPSGTISVTGTHAVQSGTQNASYTVSTSTPLVYDATCGYLPRLTAGAVVLTPAQTGSSITITYTGCGNLPTITKS